MTWPTEELRRIIEADDLKIAPLREDGLTVGTPTWVWCVSVEGELFVRAYNGRRSSWYRAAARQRSGKILAAGMTRDVVFEPVEGHDGQIDDRINDAYRAKYKASTYLGRMISREAREATVKVVRTAANT